MPQRQDYLLRLIEELGRFVAEATKFRNTGHYDAALLAILQAQERIFARPSQDFTARTVEDQLRLLTLGESDAGAAEKCLAYAGLIVEAGLVYRDRGQPPVALGACRLALQVVALARQRFPHAEVTPVHARVEALLASLPEGEMKSEIVDLLPRSDRAPGESTPAVPITPPPPPA
jgi:hypothetical protein